MLEANDLACLKGDRLLFKALSLRVAPGEMLRIGGPNGFGKTSLLRILCGLSLPEYGEVRWLGEDIRHEREAFHRALLYVGHAPALNDLLTPLENLRFACRIGGDDADAAACEAALTRTGLAAQLDLPARVLSQGQRRRVGLARLFLAQRRQLWVLDEPFNTLDVRAVADLAETLSSHCRAGGAVVLVTHQDAQFSVVPRILDLTEVAVG